MGFKVHTVSDNAVPPHEWINAKDSVDYVAGQVLSLKDGTVDVLKSGGSADYICQRTGKAINGQVPCVKVTDNVKFAVPFNASASSVKPGMTVAVHTDGQAVTATAATGAGGFTVTAKDGDEAGSICYGYFATKAGGAG